MIAVVDDDDAFRQAIVGSLRSLSYRVREFASAEAFVAAFGSSAFDCLVTDIHMPGMTGLELQRLLSAQTPELPVVMITARTDPALEARALKNGAVCLLRKPFRAEALVACLEAAMDRQWR